MGITPTYQEIKNFKDGCKVYWNEMEEVFTNVSRMKRKVNLIKQTNFGDYINFMHLYHNFTQSIRMGDLETFISCLPKITNIFFALNHPNYARWLVKYYDSVLKLNETNPEK